MLDKVDVVIQQCHFCKIAHRVDTPSLVDNILLENEDFFAICSIGGFIPGWTLIFSKKHLYNLSTYYKAPIFLDFVNEVKDLISKKYGHCIVFEHGALENSITACGVNHAHLHIVPFSQKIELLTQQKHEQMEWDKIDILRIESIVDGSEYLFCSDEFSHSNSQGIVTILKNPISQFFRKILAEAVGLDDLYDYKRYKFIEHSEQTHNTLCSLLALTEN